MGGLQVGVDVLRRQDLYVQFPGLGHNTVLAGVSLDQPLLHSPVQGTVEHQMDAAHSGGAQALVLVLSDVYSATLQQLLVELLQVPGGQLLQFDAADAPVRATWPTRKSWPRPSPTSRSKQKPYSNRICIRPEGGGNPPPSGFLKGGIRHV